MPILDELIEYANNCLSDRYISEFENYLSCKKHKQACKRFLNDIDKYNTDDNYAYYWDENEAQKIVKWFSYLEHSTGELSGQPIILIPWQQFFVCQIYGWRKKENHRRRFTKSYVQVGRKNAKSQLESGIALYELAVTSTKNNEVLDIASAGVKRKQSKIVFDECKKMLKNSPLSLKFKVTRDYIQHIKTGSVMTPLSKEDGQKNDGGNISLFILDEYHQHPDSSFYTMASYGQSTKEPLLMIITTAGKDLTYPCYTQEYKYCSELLDSDVDVNNDSYFVDILELDKADDINNSANWFKANPIRMTFVAGQQKLKEDYKIAKDIPEKLPDFKTKCLNIWVQAKQNGYMNMARWRNCEVKNIPYDLSGKDVYVGFDMSAKIDLTSVAFILPIMDNGTAKYVVYSHSFIPDHQKLREHIETDKQPYDSWMTEGFITITDTPIVDQQQVLDYVIDFCKKNNWKINSLCFDPTNSSKLMMDASNLGYQVVEVYQSQKSLNEATEGFREQIYSGNVLHPYNPVLDYAMANAMIKPNNGLIKIDKDATPKRIDPVDAVLCAYKLAYYHEFTKMPDITEDYLSKLGW